MNGLLRAPPRLRAPRALILGCTASVSLLHRCRRRVPFPRSSSGLVGIGAVAAEERSVRSVSSVQSVSRVVLASTATQQQKPSSTWEKPPRDSRTFALPFATRHRSRPARRSDSDAPCTRWRLTALHVDSESHQFKSGQWAVGSFGLQPNGRFVPNDLPLATCHQPLTSPVRRYRGPPARDRVLYRAAPAERPCFPSRASDGTPRPAHHVCGRSSNPSARRR